MRGRHHGARWQAKRDTALEATGVYWINLYVALELAGFEVVVINGPHCRNFPVELRFL